LTLWAVDGLAGTPALVGEHGRRWHLQVRS
jgi:hypothetical protein